MGPEGGSAISKAIPKGLRTFSPGLARARRSQAKAGVCEPTLGKRTNKFNNPEGVVEGRLGSSDLQNWMHLGAMNLCRSGATISPRRGNSFSLSPGERAGVRAGYLDTNFPLGSWERLRDHSRTVFRCFGGREQKARHQARNHESRNFPINKQKGTKETKKNRILIFVVFLSFCSIGERG